MKKSYLSLYARDINTDQPEHQGSLIRACSIPYIKIIHVAHPVIQVGAFYPQARQEKTSPEVIKLVFMLNSTEQVIAYKC